MKTNLCPLCKTQLQTVYTTKDYLVSGESFDIVECQDCALRLTNPFPEENKVNEYYASEDYVSHSEHKKNIFNFIYSSVRDFMLIRKRKLIEKKSGLSKGTLLDFGCGLGHFLNQMKENGWNVFGIDSSPKAKKSVENRFDIRVYSPDEWLNSNETYDIITCWHSLEHIHKPWVYLEQFRERLNPNGLLIIALPNFKSADAEKFKGFWAAYDTPRHFYHFSIKSMSKLTEKNGFSIQTIHRLYFDTFYVSILSAKHMGKSLISGVWSGTVSFLSAAIHKEKCSSLIYILN